MANAPIYKEKDVVGHPELLSQLETAIEELDVHMRASVPIKRGGCHVGFGVSKVQCGIAADTVISIARAIKSQKGW